VEKRLMEDLEVRVNRSDAERLLSREDCETLELFTESIRRGRTLLPWAEHEYYRLIDGLEDKKRMELVRAMFREYEEKVKDDELRLKELSEGTSISTRQEALELFVRDFPNYKRLLERSDPSTWLPGHLQKIRNEAEGYIEGIFDYGLMEEVENPEAFGCEKKVWSFIVPHVNYVKMGLDSLEFSFTPHAVTTSKVHRAAHKKTLKGWSYTYPSSNEPLYLCTEILYPGSLNTSLPKIVLPLRLLRGLALGGLQPDGCEVIMHKDGALTYMVEGFNSEVVLPYEFVKFITELGENPLNRLQEIGLLDDITFKILETKREVTPIETPILREKDKEQLRIIAEMGSRSSWGGWGEALGMSRQGAKDQLLRFEERGLIELERSENGETRAIMTPLGQAYLV
jgi:hypothetical protein